MIIQSIALLDTLDKDINTFVMRVREWYSWHFPELVRIVPDNYLYTRAALQVKVRARPGAGRHACLWVTLGRVHATAAWPAASGRQCCRAPLAPLRTSPRCPRSTCPRWRRSWGTRTRQRRWAVQQRMRGGPASRLPGRRRQLLCWTLASAPSSTCSHTRRAGCRRCSTPRAPAWARTSRPSTSSTCPRLRRASSSWPSTGGAGGRARGAVELLLVWRAQGREPCWCCHAHAACAARLHCTAQAQPALVPV